MPVFKEKLVTELGVEHELGLQIISKDFKSERERIEYVQEE